MRTKITFFIATVTLLFSVTTTSAQTNLFTNPSFEDAELTTHEDDGSWRMLEIYTTTLLNFYILMMVLLVRL